MSIEDSSQKVLAASIICQTLRGSHSYNSRNRCWPKILKRISLKTGHSKIKWLDVSSSSPQALQIGSGYFSGFSRWLWRPRKLWPEIHLKNSPYFSLLHPSNSLDFFSWGSAKKILVCRAFATEHHRSLHFSQTKFLRALLNHVLDTGRTGSTPGVFHIAPNLALVSANSLPACPWCALIQWSLTWQDRESLCNLMIHSLTRDDFTTWLLIASRADLESEMILMLERGLIGELESLFTIYKAKSS